MFLNNRFVLKVNWEKLDQLRSERLEVPKERVNIYTLDICRELIRNVDVAMEDLKHDLYWSPEDSAAFKKRFERITPTKELTNKYKELVNETKKLKRKEEIMNELRSGLIRNRINNDMINELKELDNNLEAEIFGQFYEKINKEIVEVYEEIESFHKRDVRGSLGLDQLYPLYIKFRTLWSLSPIPPEIPNDRVKDIFEKENETRSMLEVRNIFRNIFIASVPYIEEYLTDFSLGFIDQFKKRGKSIGEFIAVFYQDPKEVAISVLRYTAEYLSQIAADPAKFVGESLDKVFKWFSEYKDEIITSQGQGFAYDMGRSVAIGITYVFLRKLPVKTKAPLFIASHTEKIDFSLKNTERTKELFINLISKIFKNSKLTDEEINIIADSLMKNILKKSMSERDKIYLSFVQYYLSDQKSLPSIDDLNMTLEFLLNSLYDRTVKNKISEKRLCEIIKSIPSNDGIDKMRYELSKQEEAMYSGQITGEMIAFYLSKKFELFNIDLTEANKEKNRDEISAIVKNIYNDFNAGKLPPRDESMKVLKILIGFRYHLAKEINDSDKEMKMIYVLLKNLNESRKIKKG